MNIKEICEYLISVEKCYHEACRDRQEALEIFEDIIKNGALNITKIYEWYNRVPHMSSKETFKNVFK